jgi:hypothetical protein
MQLFLYVSLGFIFEFGLEEGLGQGAKGRGNLRGAGDARKLVRTGLTDIDEILRAAEFGLVNRWEHSSR